MKNKKERILLIDANALIHRAFHALPPLTNSKGQQIGAVYGFFQIFFKAASELGPKYVAVAFDSPAATFRHKIYTEYKATRQKTPDDLVSQFPLVKNVLTALNLPIFEIPGYEADDIVGTLAKRSEKQNLETIIVTGDMDEVQLVTENTEVYTMKKGFTDTVIFDLNAVKEKYQMTPAQFIDYKALKGDTSDNIPGVPGIGEKTAISLIVEYGSLDGIYDDLEHDLLRAPDRVKNTLRCHKEQAYLSKFLSQIDTNISLAFNINNAMWGNFNREDVIKIFQELEFRSLLSKIPITKELSPIKKQTKFGFECLVVSNDESYNKFFLEAKNKNVWVIDTETDNLDRLSPKMVGFSIAFDESGGYYFQPSAAWPLEQILKKIKPYLEDEKILKIGHNIKYDYFVFKGAGINLRAINFDTMIAAYILSPGDRRYGLNELSFTEFGYEKILISDLTRKGKEQIKMSEVPVEKIAVYACEDVVMTYKLYEKYRTLIKEENLTFVFEKIEMPLITVLAQMETNGIKLDKVLLKDMAVVMTNQIIALEKEIYGLVGKKFNINSPAQLKKILFVGMGLHEFIDKKSLKRVKTGGYSTAASELEKLKGKHPVIEKIMEYRELTKLKSTYVDALPLLTNSITGRIHTSFNQTATATGRLSSSDPNLQNIPIRTEVGREIRKAFISEKNNYLIAADYSQIELRLVAHIANDKRMKEAFLKEEDIHARTASEIMEIPLDKVSYEQRRAAKAINFGIIYGISPHGLSKGVGISFESAKAYIDKYFAVYSGIKEYTENIVKTAREKGYVETVFGRKRYLPEINASNYNVRSAAERMAINFPIQGSAADIMKMAMINLCGETRNFNNFKILLQVHDELVAEIPKAKLQMAAEKIRKIMESVVSISVPIRVNVSFGINWGELKEI